MTDLIHKDQITSSHGLFVHVNMNKLSDLFGNKDHRQEREELKAHTDTHFLVVLLLCPKARDESLIHSGFGSVSEIFFLSISMCFPNTSCSVLNGRCELIIAVIPPRIASTDSYVCLIQ